MSFPFSEEIIRALKAGDEVLISGSGFNGREVCISCYFYRTSS